MPASKPATLVGPHDQIALVGDDEPWASRAGNKLAAALDRFGVDAEDRRCLDVGASTGGFTDVLLRRGAASVTALDVGYGQLLTRLVRDPRVRVVDRTNFRTVDPATLGPPFDLVTVDVSFISVCLLTGNLAAVGRPGAAYVVLVKPQFEAGKDAVGRGGLVRNPTEWAGAVERVAACLHSAGIGFGGAAPSELPGSGGNREFFVLAHRGAPEPPDPEVITMAVSS